MKKSKFIQRTVSCILAAAMMATLASCDKFTRNGSSGGNSNQGRQIVNYYTSEMYTKPEELGYVQSAFAKDGFIYLYGYKDSTAAETVSFFYNTETGESKDLNLDSLNSENISSLYFFGDSALVCYYEKDTYNNKMAMVDVATGNVTADVAAGGSSYISAAGLDADGNIVTVEEDYSSSRDAIVKKVYDAKTLENKANINLSKELGLTGFSYPSNAVFNPDGSMYLSIMTFDENYENSELKILKADSDGKVIYEADDFSDLSANGSAGTIFRKEDGKVCVMSMSYDDFSTLYFSEMDEETGAVGDRFEAKLNANSIQALITDYAGADLVYTDDKGVWKVDIASGTSEKMFTFGEELPESCSQCYDVQYRNGSLYFHGEIYEGGNSYGLYKMDSDGNIVEEISVTDDEDSSVFSVLADKNGNMMLLKQKYNYDEETGDGSCQYRLVTVDGDGNEQSSVDLSAASESNNSYIYDVCVLDSGEIAVAVEDYDYSTYEQSFTIVIFDASGNVKSRTVCEDINYINKMISSASGMYVFCQGKTGSVINTVNTETGELTKAELDIPMYVTPMESDGNYDFCYSDSNGIYGFSIAENKSTEIINWIDSDISFNVTESFFYDENTIVCIGYDYTSGDYQLYFLKRADEETLKKIQNKTLITVAGADLGYSTLKDKVVEFNKNSDEYRVQLNDYSKYDKYEDDTYVSGAFKLNEDMTSGNIPDIIVGNGEVDMTSFAAKKIITDLGPFLEKDADISREDYFENVLDALSYNGKLCQITSDFTLTVLAGPASKLGSETSWTNEEFMKLRDNGRIFYTKTEREFLLNTFIRSNLAEYVDFENKKCDFSNDRFISLVDLIAEEGYVYDENAEEDENYNYNDACNSRFKDGECQLEISDISSFYSILDLQQGAIGAEVTIKGVPSENSTGILINPSTSFAICEKSKNKDAAWEFIKMYLGADYQNQFAEEESSYRIPLMKSAFEKCINKAKTGTGYSGYSVTKPDGTFEDMKALDDTTAAKIMDAVTSADRIAVSDERINSIIDEALDEVFNGTKTSSEAASEIQSKVSTYLNEIK